MDLSVIVVNWNVRQLLYNCLTSVRAACQFSQTLAAEIIVVDNASHDGSPQMVRSYFPEVRLFASERNLGYAGGNNQGVQLARGRYYFLLNPDTEVEPDVLLTLLQYMDTHPEAGAVGPQLRWPDGSIQSSRRRFPTLGSLFCESTLPGQWFPNNRYIRRYHMRDCSPDQTQPVDWVVGAALMIRAETWQRVGPIDEEFFMYFEETDWCRRCVAAGSQVHYLPTARVTHHEGKSSEQVMAARTIRFQRSKLRYTRKYFGAGWAALLRVFLWLTFSWQWLEEGSKWLIGHRRSLRRARMSAYGQVLRRL